MNSSENFPQRDLPALVAPFVLFLLLTSLEPTPGKDGLFGLIPYARYPAMYLFKLAAVTLAAGFCFPAWLRMFPLRAGFGKKTAIFALFGGILGAGLWVGVSKLQWTFGFAGIPGLADGSRSAFDPFANLAPDSAWVFWTARMFGLAVLVPVVEEIFLRGFLLRYLEGQNWRELAVGTLTRMTWAATLIYAAATHPAELCAALLWFAGVTWFVSRTKNIWSAVAVHAVTNFTLGMYVLLSKDWRFW